MTNDERRSSKRGGQPARAASPPPKLRVSEFVIRISFEIRHWSFVISIAPYTHLCIVVVVGCVPGGVLSTSVLRLTTIFLSCAMKETSAEIRRIGFSFQDSLRSVHWN